MSPDPTASFSQQQLTDQASHPSGSALARALATHERWAPLVLRWTLALVLFPHGAQKALGWFGGYGYSGTMGYLTGQIGLPAALAFAVIALELAGPFLLLAGLATRLVAAGVAVLMVGAIVTTHLPNGFFMDWSGSLAGEGYEYHLLVIGMALALLAAGAGRLSLDGRLGRAR
jgi:putative oxidoreductase